MIQNVLSLLTKKVTSYLLLTQSHITTLEGRIEKMLIKLTPWQIFNLVLNGQPVEIDILNQALDILDNPQKLQIQAITATEPAIQDFIHYQLLSKLLSPLGIELDTGLLLYGLRHKVTANPDHSLTVE